MRILIAAIAVLGALPLSAQLRRVEMKLSGIDCDSCAVSVDRVVKRIRGVDEATFDAKANLVTVTFKPDNNVKLKAIRDAVKNLGYTPGETRLTARGTLTAERFEVTGVDTAFKVEISEALRKSAGPDVIVEGTVPEKDQDALQVRAVTKPE